MNKDTPPNAGLSSTLVKELCTTHRQIARRNTYLTILVAILGIAVGILVTIVASG